MKHPQATCGLEYLLLVLNINNISSKQIPNAHNYKPTTSISS